MTFIPMLRARFLPSVAIAALVFLSGVASAQQPGPFDTAGAPSEQALYHSTKPQIVAVPVNGGLVVGWREYTGAKAGGSRLTRYAIDGTARKVWEKTLPLPVLGGVTTDGTNVYVLCARDEDLRDDRTKVNYRPGVLQMVKFDAAGNVVWSHDLNNERYLGPVDGNGQANRGIYSPFTGGTAQVQFGNGRIQVAMAVNTLHDGGARHQKATFFTVNEDGSGTASVSESSAHHSFDQRVLFDGTDFVISELADAGWFMPAAGITIRKAKAKDGRTAFVPDAAEGVYVYARRGNGDSYSNSSFTSLGDFALGERGYVGLFASQTSNGQPPDSGFNSPVPEPRNVAMVHVVKEFETVRDGRQFLPGQNEATPRAGNVDVDWRNGFNVTRINITRNIVDSNGPTTDPITRADNPAKTFHQHGVLWLTNLPAGTSAERPRLVRVGDGKYLALWEEWTYQGTGQNLKHQATKAMLLGEYGNVLRPAAAINARLNPAGADRPFADGPSAAWLSGNNATGKFTLHRVDENLAVNSYDIGL